MFTPHKLLIKSLALVFIFVSFSSAFAANFLQEKSRVITASAVRVRSEPQTTAKEITKLSVGTVVKEIGKTEKKEKIGQDQDFWYQVVLSDGKQGWVFGGFTESFDESKKEQIYVNLLNSRLKEKTSFNDQVDLVNFLEKAIKEVKTPDILGELELGQLLAIRQSVDSIPPDKSDSGQYKSWLKKQDAKIYYDEIQGYWKIRYDVFWDLQEKYKALPVGDKIAWEAAINPRGGECEGFVSCYIAVLNSSTARYLSLYPIGKHSEEALKEISEEFNTYVEDLGKSEKTYNFPEDAEMRKDLQEQLSEIKSLLSKVAAAKTATIFKQIEKLETKFR
ncbi:MAG: SH3 domain-containing protein [Blastocatellia bacterium]